MSNTSPTSPTSPVSPAHDEPEITQERDVPLDGADADGEKLMKEVRNDRLEVTPGEEEANEHRNEVPPQK